MNDNNNMMTLPKRGLKTRSYNKDMNKKDLKKLTKGQLIRLLMNQQKNEEVESIKKPTNSTTENWKMGKRKTQTHSMKQRQ